VRTVTLYRLSGLAVMIGMTIDGLAVLEVGTEAMFAFVGPVLAAHDETHFLLQGGLEQNLGGGFLAYFALSYLVILPASSASGLPPSGRVSTRVGPGW
jgi:hypothetical protein